MQATLWDSIVMDEWIHVHLEALASFDDDLTLEAHGTFMDRPLFIITVPDAVPTLVMGTVRRYSL